MFRSSMPGTRDKGQIYISYPTIILYSFFMANNIPLYEYTVFCLSIWVVSTFGYVNSTAVNIHVQFLCGHIFSFLLGNYPEMELLNQMVTNSI